MKALNTMISDLTSVSHSLAERARNEDLVHASWNRQAGELRGQLERCQREEAELREQVAAADGARARVAAEVTATRQAAVEAQHILSRLRQRRDSCNRDKEQSAFETQRLHSQLAQVKADVEARLAETGRLEQEKNAAASLLEKVKATLMAQQLREQELRAQAEKVRAAVPLPDTGTADLLRLDPRPSKVHDSQGHVTVLGGRHRHRHNHTVPVSDTSGETSLTTPHVCSPFYPAHC